MLPGIHNMSFSGVIIAVLFLRVKKITRFIWRNWVRLALNPVRADIVKHPADYPWSSYHFNALGVSNSLIKIHPIYTALGRGKSGRQSVYRALFKHQIPERTIDEIRAATNKAWVLGNERFLQQIADLTQRQTQPKPRGGDKRSKKAKVGNGNRV